MNRELILRPEAEADLAAAFSWYQERAHGLGFEFLNSLDAAIHGIIRDPELYPIVHRRIRRALMRRFPYAVFYMVGSTHVVVLAIFHTSRNPTHWQQRT